MKYKGRRRIKGCLERREWWLEIPTMAGSSIRLAKSLPLITRKAATGRWLLPVGLLTSEACRMIDLCRKVDVQEKDRK